ncbi:hypothetical protein V8C86DRAFT_1250923 [Haematococcus lacustris]
MAYDNELAGVHDMARAADEGLGLERSCCLVDLDAFTGLARTSDPALSGEELAWLLRRQLREAAKDVILALRAQEAYAATRERLLHHTLHRGAAGRMPGLRFTSVSSRPEKLAMLLVSVSRVHQDRVHLSNDRAQAGEEKCDQGQECDPGHREPAATTPASEEPSEVTAQQPMASFSPASIISASRRVLSRCPSDAPASAFPHPPAADSWQQAPGGQGNPGAGQGGRQGPGGWRRLAQAPALPPGLWGRVQALGLDPLQVLLEAGMPLAHIADVLSCSDLLTPDTATHLLACLQQHQQQGQQQQGAASSTPRVPQQRFTVNQLRRSPSLPPPPAQAVEEAKQGAGLCAPPLTSLVLPPGPLLQLGGRQAGQPAPAPRPTQPAPHPASGDQFSLEGGPGAALNPTGCPPHSAPPRAMAPRGPGLPPLGRPSPQHTAARGGRGARGSGSPAAAGSSPGLSARHSLGGEAAERAARAASPAPSLTGVETGVQGGLTGLAAVLAAAAGSMRPQGWCEEAVDTAGPSAPRGTACGAATPLAATPCPAAAPPLAAAHLGMASSLPGVFSSAASPPPLGQGSLAVRALSCSSGALSRGSRWASSLTPPSVAQAACALSASRVALNAAVAMGLEQLQAAAALAGCRSDSGSQPDALDCDSASGEGKAAALEDRLQPAGPPLCVGKVLLRGQSRNAQALRPSSALLRQTSSANGAFGYGGSDCPGCWVDMRRGSHPGQHQTRAEHAGTCTAAPRPIVSNKSSPAAADGRDVGQPPSGDEIPRARRISCPARAANSAAAMPQCSRGLAGGQLASRARRASEAGMRHSQARAS